MLFLKYVRDTHWVSDSRVQLCLFSFAQIANMCPAIRLGAVSSVCRTSSEMFTFSWHYVQRNVMHMAEPERKQFGLCFDHRIPYTYTVHSAARTHL